MAYIEDESVKKLKLNNQSGTVCSLECYYKDGHEGKTSRIGSTGSIPVGQSVELDLSTIEELNKKVDAGETIYVTAFANVKAGKDSHGNVWAKYNQDSNKTAEYTISGVINFTEIAFNDVVED